MTCIQIAPGVSLNMASDRFLRKVITYCPTDECITEMVARHERWHGTSLYCCKCGESWADEGRYPRPFRPGWRAKAVAYHRELWDRASHGPPPTMDELYPSEYEIVRRAASEAS